MKFFSAARLFAVLSCGAIAAPFALAHHSVAGQFDVSKTMQLSGHVSKVDWINPHIYLYLDVKEKDGVVSTWRLETLPVAMMRKAGLSKQSLMSEGQTVNVFVHPARDGTKNLGFMLKITYPDGRHFQFSKDPNDKTGIVN